MSKVFDRKTIVYLLFLALLGGFPSQAVSAEYELESSTLLHIYENDTLPGENRFASLYEYLDLSVYGLGSHDLSFFLYGWGRLDLADDPGSNSNGNLSSAYLQYDIPNQRGRLRAGRFSLTEGTTLEVIDGIAHKNYLPGGFGATFYGGSPVEEEDLNGGSGIYGGRGFYQMPGTLEVGLSYLFEKGDFLGEDRQEAGGDLWYGPAESFDLTGKVIYNLATEGLASASVSARLSPSPSIDLEVGTRNYSYGDLFQAALNPAFSASTLNPADEVNTVFVVLDWKLASPLSACFTMENINHELSDPGNSSRSEVALTFIPGSLFERVGVSAAVVSGDLSENEYSEIRGYATKKYASTIFSIDALTQKYEEKISGEDMTVQLIGSAGWSMTDSMKLSGDLRYTRSPRFDNDLAVILRVNYNISGQSGGT